MNWINEQKFNDNFTVKIRIKAVLNIQHLRVKCLTFEQQDRSLSATPFLAAIAVLFPCMLSSFAS